MVAALLAVMGVSAPLLALWRLNLSLMSGWTAFLEQLAERLKQDDLTAARGLCAERPGSLMAPLTLVGLRLVEQAPDELEEAERYLAEGLAPTMVAQWRRIRGLGMLALVGVVPAAAMGLGLPFVANWTRYVAFIALLLGVLAAARAHIVRTRIVQRCVVALIAILAHHAAQRPARDLAATASQPGKTPKLRVDR